MSILRRGCDAVSNQESRALLVIMGLKSDSDTDKQMVNSRVVEGIIRRRVLSDDFYAILGISVIGEGTYVFHVPFIKVRLVLYRLVHAFSQSRAPSFTLIS